MAKEMNVRCNFLENNLMCVLLEHTNLGHTSQGEDLDRRIYILRRCLYQDIEV